MSSDLYKKVTLKVEIVGIEEYSDYDKMIIEEAIKAVNESVGKKYAIKLENKPSYYDNKVFSEVLYPILSDREKKSLVDQSNLKKQITQLLK